jgi:hypothetical protein
MNPLLRGVSPGRFLLASFVATIIGFLIHFVGALATLEYYMDPAYFCVWSRFMIPTAGPPPVEFTIASLVLGFIASLIFVIVYIYLKPALGGMSDTRAGAMYGFGVFLVGGLPGFFMIWLLVNIPFVLIMSYTIETLVSYMLIGMTVGKILR